MATEEWFGYGRLILVKFRKLHSLYMGCAPWKKLFTACNVDQKKIKRIFNGDACRSYFFRV